MRDNVVGIVSAIVSYIVYVTLCVERMVLYHRVTHLIDWLSHVTRGVNYSFRLWMACRLTLHVYHVPCLSSRRQPY